MLAGETIESYQNIKGIGEESLEMQLCVQGL